jgi:hypothetical protein
MATTDDSSFRLADFYNMVRDKLSNLYRGLPIDDTYQVSVYLAKQFQDFLEINQSETRIVCGGHEDC